MFILVKAIEEMTNIQPPWTCLVNKNAHCNIYLLHIKDALILLKFLLIHVLLSTSPIIKLISPVPKQFIIYDINPSTCSLKQLMTFG